MTLSHPPCCHLSIKVLFYFMVLNIIIVALTISEYMLNINIGYGMVDCMNLSGIDYVCMGMFVGFS